ncbi:MAG: glutamate--tRNA ligase [Chromatiales bacterium]|nr:glutamate--tRNA ligase [Chromatiales bacterium]
MTVRTRFAPSPTGYLHIGGARTALFSWLHARRHGGTFILRIEDTDLERSTIESVNAILESMAWLGLNYDEGPFAQSERMDRYREVIARLLAEGKAYHCYCSRERLEELREGQMARKEKPRYDGLCRHREGPAPSGVSPVVRFLNPTGGEVVIEDLIRGRVVISNSELDDLIIARSDGVPTYNFVVVVDDYDMRITHVIRGDDHINNTPRQINILRALGAELPVYAHVPMILGEDGKRLSKRHGAVSVMNFHGDGILPEALLNYLARLGWSHGDQEVFSVEDMVRLFDVANVNNSAAVFDYAKLLWLNQHYLKTSPPERIAAQFGWQLGRIGIDPAHGPDIVKVIELQRERAKTLKEMAEISAFFYRDFDNYEADAARKHLTADAQAPLARMRAALATLEDWSAAPLHAVLVTVAEELGLKLGKVAQPLRVAVCGRAASPGIDVTLALLGRATTLRRIDRALALINEGTGEGKTA